MTDGSARRVFPDASRFENIGSVIDGPLWCRWPGCREPQFFDIPVCAEHGIHIAGYMVDAGRMAQDVGLEYSPPLPTPRYHYFVYYLMIGPATVKIGTTRQLEQRIRGLRTELQYVVALEHGDFKVEHQRHREFDAERITRRREDFRVSERLQHHIETLQPRRDELVRLATTHRDFGDAV